MANISVGVNKGRFSQILVRLTNGTEFNGSGVVTGKWYFGLTVATVIIYGLTLSVGIASLIVPLVKEEPNHASHRIVNPGGLPNAEGERWAHGRFW